MTLSHLARVLLVVALASAGACKNTPTTKSGLPWWPQGPGNPPGSEAVAPAEDARPNAPAAEPQRQASATTGPAAAAPDSEAQATRYGDLLFLSGQSAAGGGNIAEQTNAAMQKIGAILDSNRLTMANVVNVTVYLASIKDLQGMDSAYASHFRGALPARTVVAVAQLPGGALVQISVIAGR